MTQIAAITGAASGIGRGTAHRLLTDGWTVVAIDRAEQGLAKLRDDLGVGPERLETVTADVTSEESLAAAFAAITARHGKLNGFVASAGLLRTGALDAMPTRISTTCSPSTCVACGFPPSARCRC
ncbi:MAG: SDR family oxidoreductase [Hyphomicrobiaceae bacterium]